MKHPDDTSYDFIAARTAILAWVGTEGAATISLHSHK